MGQDAFYGSLSKENIEIYQYAIENGIIDLAHMRDQVNLKKTDEALQQHTSAIWQGKNGKWYTYLSDDGKRRLIKRTSKESVLAEIEASYSAKLVKNLANLYPAWRRYKEKETSAANVYKLNWVWEKYYKDDAIIKEPIDEIRTIDLKEWFLDKIDAYNITRRQFKEMKSLLNMLLDYAVELEIVPVNVSRNIRNISYKKFRQEKTKPVGDQVYINDEESRAIEIALNQFQKTGNTAYLGICLNFTLALRIGELAALKKSDIAENTVHIQRSEVSIYEEREGKLHKKGVEIVPHTKTPRSDRELILTEVSKRFLKMIIMENAKRGFISDDLFIHSDGTRMNSYSINRALRRVNELLETSQKGNHSIRKTCLSNMNESGLLTDEEISRFAGHTQVSTTQNCYLFATKSLDKRADAYERAICGKISG